MPASEPTTVICWRTPLRLKAESNSELICPSERALEYQRVAEHVYRKAGKPGAMIFRIVR